MIIRKILTYSKIIMRVGMKYNGNISLRIETQQQERLHLFENV